MPTKTTSAPREKKVSLNYPGPSEDSTKVLLGLKGNKTFQYWDLSKTRSMLNFSYHVFDVASVHRMLAKHTEVFPEDFEVYIYDPNSNVNKMFTEFAEHIRHVQTFPKMVESLLAVTGKRVLLVITQAEQVLADMESNDALQKALKAENVNVHAYVHGNKILSTDSFNFEDNKKFTQVGAVGYLLGREYTTLFEEEKTAERMRAVKNGSLGLVDTTTNKINVYDILKITRDWKPKELKKTDKS